MYIKAFIAVILTFLVVDIAWISLVLIDFYAATIGHLMRETPAVSGAAVFYLAYAAGIVYLAVRPAVTQESMRPAIVNGALLGALAYGTYTVTNYSIFADWTLGLVVSDILWGAFLTAVCAAVGYLSVRRTG